MSQDTKDTTLEVPTAVLVKEGYDVSDSSENRMARHLGPTRIPRKYLSEMGKKGGSVSSPAKTAAVRENAKKGGWPKGRPRKPKTVTEKGELPTAALGKEGYAVRDSSENRVVRLLEPMRVPVKCRACRQYFSNTSATFVERFSYCRNLGSRTY